MAYPEDRPSGFAMRPGMTGNKRMNIKFTYLPGDGIGPEVGAASLAVLEAVAEKFGHTLKSEFHLIGGAAIDAGKKPLPAETFESCERTGA